MRIVSLLPSATESLAIAGGADMLVGRSHECDFPSGLEHLPVLTAPRAAYDPAVGMDAAAVDDRVTAATASNESLYELDIDRLRDLRPDLILTQDLCEVCSIDLGTVRRVAESLDRRPEIVSLNPTTIEGVLDDVLAVGRAAGLEERSRLAVVDLRGRLFRAQEFVNQFADGPVVGFMEWTDPIYCAGHWTVQMIERAGGRHPWNEAVPVEDSGAAAGPMQAERIAGKSIRVPPELFAAAGPERLVISPCGLNLNQTREAVAKIADRDWFQQLPAVRSGRVALVDGNQMFNRPGPRLVEAFEWLVSWIQDRPQLCPEGFPWEPWEG
ncbi:MAG: ABC transporter substrate-binding protein [Planctomycetota bacterium]